VSSDDVERAIQRLADSAVSLTLDQRLRIAALLARQAAPEATASSRENALPTAVTAQSLVLTVEETADLLKVGRTTVYDLLKTGKLRSIMIGRLRRIRHTDVMAYLTRQTDAKPRNETRHR
jgi:excisionase family DNA binding protein